MTKNGFLCTYREKFVDDSGETQIHEPDMLSDEPEVKPLKAWEGKEIERVCFLFFKDSEYILKRAEKHEVYLEKRPYDKEEYEEDYYK